MLDHELLRGLRSAARVVAALREVDVANLPENQYTEVDERLTQIISDAIRIRSRLTSAD